MKRLIMCEGANELMLIKILLENDSKGWDSDELKDWYKEEKENFTCSLYVFVLT